MKSSLNVTSNSAKVLRNIEGQDPRDEFKKSLGMILISLATFMGGLQYGLFTVQSENYYAHFKAESFKWWIDLFSPLASVLLMVGVYFLSEKSFRVGFMVSLTLSFLSSVIYFLAYDLNSLTLLCIGLLLTNQCTPILLSRKFISYYQQPQDRTRSSGILTCAYLLGLGIGYFIGPSFLKSHRELMSITINSMNSGSFMLSILWLALILLASTQKYTSKSIVKSTGSITSGLVEAYLYISYAVFFFNLMLFTDPVSLSHQVSASSSTIYLWAGLFPLITSPVYMILYAGSYFLEDSILLIAGVSVALVALGILVVPFATFWYILGCVLLYLGSHIALSLQLGIGMKTSFSGRVVLILSILAVVFENAGRFAGDFNSLGFRIAGLTGTVGVLLWGIFIFKRL